MRLITNRFALITAATVVAGIALAAGSFWYLFLRNDAPPEVSLAGAVDTIATAEPSSTATASSEATDDDAVATDVALDGAWAVAASGETFVGYRVGEELANIGTTTAVGRTSGVVATVEIAGGVLVSAEVEADLTALASDNSMRDGQLRNQAIETNTYPTATFVASGNLALPGALESGQAVAFDLVGSFTLHGVTNEVVVPVEVQLVDGYLVVVGSIEIQFADYDIEKPNGASVLSIADHGVMELQIVLSQDGGNS